MAALALLRGERGTLAGYGGGRGRAHRRVAEPVHRLHRRQAARALVPAQVVGGRRRGQPALRAAHVGQRLSNSPLERIVESTRLAEPNKRGVMCLTYVCVQATFSCPLGGATGRVGSPVGAED